MSHTFPTAVRRTLPNCPDPLSGVPGNSPILQYPAFPSTSDVRSPGLVSCDFSEPPLSSGKLRMTRLRHCPWLIQAFPRLSLPRQPPDDATSHELIVSHVVLVVSDSEHTSSLFPLHKYITYIYRWDRINEQISNITLKIANSEFLVMCIRPFGTPGAGSTFPPNCRR